MLQVGRGYRITGAVARAIREPGRLRLAHGQLVELASRRMSEAKEIAVLIWSDYI
jgi:hypothetical protein